MNIKAYALRALDAVVDEFWAEIAECLPDMCASAPSLRPRPAALSNARPPRPGARSEALYEDEGFVSRPLAALVASKVYYHLGELNDALTYALGAGELFEVSASSEFVDTLLGKCINEYCTQHVRLVEGRRPADGEMPADGEAVGSLDSRLTAIVERMFEACFEKAQSKQVLGIALEARRLDVIHRALTGTTLPGVDGESSLDAVLAAAAAAGPIAEGDAPDVEAMLEHCLNASKTAVTSRDWRSTLLRLLVAIYKRLPEPDYLGLCECLARLDDGEAVAATLEKLVEGSAEDFLVACQVAFDIAENGSQGLISRITNVTKPPAPAPPAASPAAAPTAAAPAVAGGDAPVPMETEAMAPAAEENPLVARRSKVVRILSNELPISLHLEFLCRNNHTDLAVLTQMKAAVEPRNALCHSAIVLAHALMSAGTTSDTFLRDNLEWLSRATNWAKFVATATLGVIHRGHTSQARQLLQPYLPTQGLSASPFSEGGALMALGLIHANHGADALDFLVEALRNAGSNETVQHGACLGLGLAGMATENAMLYDELKGVLYNDSAVAGEAAALAIGLVLVGSGSARAAEEMLAYAHDTAHEKIIRSLALALALLQYGREEAAEGMITQLLLDKDDILRYGGAYALALAYVGTASNSAIRRVLDVAVSDVSDNVRRAAVTAIGFILCNTPAQCPKVVGLLAESYNPHVRYGATMALGVACAGTALREATDLLQTMLTDPVEYVRQGALIAMAMVLLQSSPQGPESRVGAFRKQLEKVRVHAFHAPRLGGAGGPQLTRAACTQVISDKHEEPMTRFGAILASGIVEAGGRNVTIQLMSQRGMPPPPPPCARRNRDSPCSCGPFPLRRRRGRAQEACAHRGHGRLHQLLVLAPAHSFHLPRLLTDGAHRPQCGPQNAQVELPVQRAALHVRLRAADEGRHQDKDGQGAFTAKLHLPARALRGALLS